MFTVSPQISPVVNLKSVSALSYNFTYVIMAVHGSFTKREIRKKAVKLLGKQLQYAVV